MWNKDFMAAINFPGLHLFDAAGPGVVVVLSARRWSPLISCCGVMGLPCISRFAFNDPIDRTAYSNRESAPNYPDLIYSFSFAPDSLMAYILESIKAAESKSYLGN